MHKSKSFTVLLASIILLGGCETAQQAFSGDSPQLVAAPDSVSAMLADAADRASTALETLAAVEYSRSPGVAVSTIGDAPAELRRAITVNWVGPVEPITKTLADRAGYNFLAIGNAPPVPLVVSLDVENRPIIDVMRDIGLQLGLRADVKVDAARKAVEIHYAPNSGI
ncbi:MAG: DotD/TraH family lipoprotein [Alphaproteobacteria bacterium]